jgi:hypothetical protein
MKVIDSIVARRLAQKQDASGTQREREYHRQHEIHQGIQKHLTASWRKIRTSKPTVGNEANKKQIGLWIVNKHLSCMNFT